MFLRECSFPCFGSNDPSQWPVQHFSGMAACKLELAVRAFAVVLLALARRYEVLLQLNRESPTEQLVKSYRKLLLKVHPDKGVRKEDTQKLQAAKEEWEKARKTSSGKAGRPSAGADGGTLVCKERRKVLRKEYRVQASVVLLTYQGCVDLAQWHRFVAFVWGSLKKCNGFPFQHIMPSHSLHCSSLALLACMCASAPSLAARSQLVQLPPAGFPHARRGLLGGAFFGPV
jgi:hypothetical protein